MGRVTRISWGRTYNTGNYSSYRIDVEYALDEADDTYDCMAFLARKVHTTACLILAERGVREIHEPGGRVTLPLAGTEGSSDDGDEIPF